MHSAVLIQNCIFITWPHEDLAFQARPSAELSAPGVLDHRRNPAFGCNSYPKQCTGQNRTTAYTQNLSRCSRDALHDVRADISELRSLTMKCEVNAAQYLAILNNPHLWERCEDLSPDNGDGAFCDRIVDLGATPLRLSYSRFPLMFCGGFLTYVSP